jgi:peptidoglycan/xylan/chitin deacetylase (PgdA/CDA1 family)
VITRRSPRRPLLAAVMLVVGAATGMTAWTATARAAGPFALDPVAVDTVVDPVAHPAPTLIRHGLRTDRIVALTFDDGWNPASLRQIYRILVRERVPATFFVTGVYVQRAPDLWRRIAAAGFPLANHSYLHRDTRDLAPGQVAQDLARTREVVEKATGRAMLPYYRPPYGARTRETDRLAAAAGFPYVVLWDTTGGDTVPHPTVSGVIRGASAGRSGSIVLLHAGPVVTPRALPAIIAGYRARGFRFVTLPEMLGTPAGSSAVTPGSLTGAIPAAPASGSGGSAASSRLVDRLGEDARPRPTGGPVTAGIAEKQPAGPRETSAAAPPARPSPGAVSPPARDAAWARRDGTPATVAVFTVAILVLLLAGAAAAGRRRGIPDGSA